MFKALKRPASRLPLVGEAIHPDESSIVFDALKQLPEDSREALVLVCIEGFAYEEAAQILNAEAGTVRVRVHRARKQFKQILGIEVASHD